MRVVRLLAVSFTFGFIGKAASDAAPPGSIPMRILNHAGAPIELFWMNTFDPGAPLVLQSEKPLRNSSDLNVIFEATSPAFKIYSSIESINFHILISHTFLSIRLTVMIHISLSSNLLNLPERMILKPILQRVQKTKQ